MTLNWPVHSRHKTGVTSNVTARFHPTYGGSGSRAEIDGAATSTETEARL